MPALSLRRRVWAKKEDEVLKALISIHGCKRGRPSESKWTEISSHLPGRTNKDCRKRWFHSLDPSLRKGRWTPEEDRIILDAYQRLGPSWKAIASLLDGRKDDQVAKRYTDILSPTVRGRLSRWTREEDAVLTDLVKTHGHKWSSIAANLPGRPALTCRNRWRCISRAAERGEQHDGDEDGDGHYRIEQLSSVESALSHDDLNGAIIDGITSPVKSSWSTDLSPSMLGTEEAFSNQKSTSLESPSYSNVVCLDAFAHFEPSTWPMASVPDLSCPSTYANDLEGHGLISDSSFLDGQLPFSSMPAISDEYQQFNVSVESDQSSFPDTHGGFTSTSLDQTNHAQFAPQYIITTITITIITTTTIIITEHGED